MNKKLWITVAACIAYCINKELYRAIDYLKAQVEVLIEEQQKHNKRIMLNDRQRIKIAAKAKLLTRKMLDECTVLFTPDTVLRWYRKLIAEKYDGSVRSVKLFCMTVRLYIIRPDLLFCQQ
jgi:putative transposase